MADGYRVEPDGVQAVLGGTAAAGSAITKAVRPLRAAIAASGPAADGIDGAGLITAALRAFDAEVSHGIAFITGRLPAASHGLHTATQAVIAGDDEMAVQIQSQAGSAFRAPGGTARWMQ